MARAAGQGQSAATVQGLHAVLPTPWPWCCASVWVEILLWGTACAAVKVGATVTCQSSFDAMVMKFQGCIMCSAVPVPPLPLTNQ